LLHCFAPRNDNLKTMAQITKTTKNGKTIIVDQDLCIGAATCVAVAPSVFQLDNDGKAYILDADFVDDETMLSAAKSCPVNAIIIKDAEGNIIWPK
jgi:ferredoxin